MRVQQMNSFYNNHIGKIDQVTVSEHVCGGGSS